MLQDTNYKIKIVKIESSVYFSYSKVQNIFIKLRNDQLINCCCRRLFMVIFFVNCPSVLSRAKI